MEEASPGKRPPPAEKWGSKRVPQKSKLSVGTEVEDRPPSGQVRGERGWRTVSWGGGYERSPAVSGQLLIVVKVCTLLLQGELVSEEEVGEDKVRLLADRATAQFGVGMMPGKAAWG